MGLRKVALQVVDKLSKVVNLRRGAVGYDVYGVLRLDNARGYRRVISRFGVLRKW